MLPIIHLGLGDIGKATLLALFAQPKRFKLVAVVDINPALAGKNLRTLLPSAPNLIIHPTISAALKHAKQKPQIATLTTASQTAQVAPTLIELIANKIHTVSTCEELAYPFLNAKKLAAALNARAQKQNVAILATGVNPGFAMDAFALAATAPVPNVAHLKITRSLDAATRRPQLQKKIGAGMSLQSVNKLIRQNAIGHVGLPESLAMIAAGLQWKISSLHQKFTALTAEKTLSSNFMTIHPRQVKGLSMRAHALINGQKKIELDLTMAFAADTFDEIQITPTPPAAPLTIRTTTGFPGESSTISLLVNAIPTLPTLAPGLRTMLDVLKIRSIGA